MDRRKLLLVVAAVVAALGVALVFVYAKGADNRAADKFDTVEVLVANKKISPGESFDDALESGKFELANVAKSQVLDGADDKSDQFEGTVALTTIYPNEQLIPVKFGGSDEVEAAVTLPIPEGKIAISIAVEDAARVGYFIRPGAQVAVISTLIDRTTQAPIVTRTLLEKVVVLAAGDTSAIDDGSSGDEEEEGGEDGIKQLLTIAVSQRQAEQVRFAEKAGELSVALLNSASTVKPDGGVNEENLFPGNED
ncbi:Flp pilus assembly protein CpaB [Nocardioides pelophilus]|uniref:Flp pilus assembly protein CpaB n=1 Tax=Nocardioides pelophilus TaxID=2172019 RepID=UPI0015FF0E6A|nr:Flp pilus assembly protein CpaB [Nocardioides pelophilus]